MASQPKYESWTKSGLIERIQALEAQLYAESTSSKPQEPITTPSTDTNNTSAPSTSTPPPKPKPKRTIDPSKYATRPIALKLAYLGKNYGGFEFQAAGNSETIEEHLWKALCRAHLIFPKDPNVVDWTCCDYSKCGRTDRGVSAFGQVIGLTVKSNRPVGEAARKRVKLDGEEVREDEGEVEGEQMEIDSGWDHIRDELAYARMLNRLLPPDIRILAWCPAPPPKFSARFSCRERQYRYFFTQPAFAPEPTSSTPANAAGSAAPVGWLDIDAMRDAAKRFEGEHDFRNFCKIDPAKMLTSFKRVMYEVSIDEVPDVSSALPWLQTQPTFPSSSAGSPLPKVYSFNVRGSAFLWHQIRHMIGILFLVGQGFEKPEIVTQMLDIDSNPRKPAYAMADEVPLVLWDCLFPANGDRDNPEGGALDWVLAEETCSLRYSELVDSVWGNWREKKMDEILANRLLQEIATQQLSRTDSEIAKAAAEAVAKKGKKGKDRPSHRAFVGGNGARPGGPYVPLMRRQLLEEPEVQVEKFAKKKGYESADDMRRQKGYLNGQDGDE